MQTRQRHIGKILFALLLLGGIGLSARNATFSLVSNEHYTGKVSTVVAHSSVFEHAGDADEFYFEDDNFNVDDDTSSSLSSETPLHAPALVPHKILTHYFGLIHAREPLPLYILYCNWKFHLS